MIARMLAHDAQVSERDSLRATDTCIDPQILLYCCRRERDWILNSPHSLEMTKSSITFFNV